jgi:hypothetical protein
MPADRGEGKLPPPQAGGQEGMPEGDWQLHPRGCGDFRATAGPAGCWPLDRAPLLLETSLPGVFAAWDVRPASIKRVTSAVGEGAAWLQFIRQYLERLQVREFTNSHVLNDTVNCVIGFLPVMSAASLATLTSGPFTRSG